MNLDGQVALVTGGGRGLGRSYALALAVAARTEVEIQAVAQEIEQQGGRALAVL